MYRHFTALYWPKTKAFIHKTHEGTPVRDTPWRTHTWWGSEWKCHTTFTNFCFVSVLKESDEDDTNHRILQTCPIFHSHTFTHRGRTLGVRTSGHCFSPALGRYQIKGDILVTPERCDVESIPPVPVGQFDISTEFDQDLDFFETAY